MKIYIIFIFHEWFILCGLNINFMVIIFISQSVKISHNIVFNIECQESVRGVGGPAGLFQEFYTSGKDL